MDQTINLTLVISALMNGNDPEVLKQEYGTETVEEAITALENRV